MPWRQYLVDLKACIIWDLKACIIWSFQMVFSAPELAQDALFSTFVVEIDFLVTW